MKVKISSRKLSCFIGALWGIISIIPYVAMAGGYVRPTQIVCALTFPAFIVFENQSRLYALLNGLVPWDVWGAVEKILFLTPILIGASIFWFGSFVFWKIRLL